MSWEKTIQEVREIMNEGKEIGLAVKDIKIIRKNNEVIIF